MELFRLFGSIMIENNGANQSLDQTEKKGFGLMGTFGKLAGVIAGALSVGAMVQFGKSAIEAAANAEAMNAQFDQVFGEIGTSAQKTIDGLGKQFGMVPTRIKPAMTQMTSMFKGLGMDTEEAMKTAESAVTVVADSAAFYDKSFEDANSALNSFIKGNYEGGEAIGLFANETQLASWASANLGVDWKNLDEAGKQVARLEFAKSMQEAAGATGQASRESDSYSNQLGNLKQTWEDLKAKLAGPVLEPVINGLKNMAEWLGKVDVDKIINGFSSFGGYISAVFKPALDDLKTALQFLWDKFKDSGGVDTAKAAFEGFKEVLAWIKDNTDVVTAVLGGLAGAFIAFQIISGINTAIGVFNTLMVALRTGTLGATLAQWGLNTAMLANPITWIVLLIGLLIAAGILLWKNWDTVKAKMTELWTNIKTKFSEIKEAVSSKISEMVSAVTNKFNEIKTAATNKFNEVKNAIMTPINAAVDTVKGAIGKIKGFFSGLSLKLPNISTPHFKLKNWSKNPLDWIKNMPSIGVDWYAKGTNYADGGLSVVGEHGPELLNLPRGSKVSTASQTRGMLQDGEQIVLNISPAPVVIDGYELAKVQFDHVDSLQSSAFGRTLILNGVKMNVSKQF
jgi:phage tail tape-measure protein